jgi:4-amino-4-deoxy-L-arabinose transferase-like glycosyltransferase
LNVVPENLTIQSRLARDTPLVDSGRLLKLATGPWIWLVLVCGVGLGLRFAALGRESFWLDEAFSWGYAKFSLGDLWREPIDVHPPVYYSLLHVLMWFGDSRWLLRAPSAVGGALAVPLIYLLGKRVAGQWVGIGAALLLATSAVAVQYSQEARSYALLTSAALVVAIGFAGLFTRADQNRRAIIAWSACYGAGSIVALYLHYISVLLVGTTFVLGTLAVARERLAPMIKAWVVTNAIILTVWLWWLPVIVEQLREGTPQFTLAPPGLGAIARGVRSLYGEKFVFWSWQGGPAFEALLITFGLVGAWVSARRGNVVGLLLAGSIWNSDPRNRT